MPAPQCPRCAYDLSGIAESWVHACPLSGLCSECGLAFDWRDILSSKRRLPRWSFEHAPRTRRLPTFLATLARAAIPPRLWRHLRIEMEIVPSRLRVFTLLSIILFKLAGMATLGAALAVTLYLQPRRGWYTPTTVERVLPILWPYRGYGPMYWRGDFISGWIVISFLTFLLVPLAFFLLPVSLRRAKVRRAHIMRIQAYALALIVPILGLWSLTQTAVVLLDHADSSLVWKFDLDDLPFGPITACFTTAWLLWAWHAAVKHYLRLPHALPVALAMLTIAALTAATAAALLYGHTLFY